MSQGVYAIPARPESRDSLAVRRWYSQRWRRGHRDGPQVSTGTEGGYGRGRRPQSPVTPTAVARTASPGTLRGWQQLTGTVRCKRFYTALSRREVSGNDANSATRQGDAGYQQRLMNNISSNHIEWLAGAVRPGTEPRPRIIEQVPDHLKRRVDGLRPIEKHRTFIIPINSQSDSSSGPIGPLDEVSPLRNHVHHESQR